MPATSCDIGPVGRPESGPAVRPRERSQPMSYPETRYLGERGEVDAVFRSADADPELRSSSGQTHYVATSRLTRGEFGLYKVDMGPHSPGPSTHFHRTISESFFILSGEVDLFDGDRW